jgi:hypothetical protein
MKKCSKDSNTVAAVSAGTGSSAVALISEEGLCTGGMCHVPAFGYCRRSGPGAEPNARALQRDPAHVDPTTASRGRLVAKSDLADSNVRKERWLLRVAPLPRRRRLDRPLV